MNGTGSDAAVGNEIGTAEADSTTDLYEFPLSFAQERLWFLDQMLGASPMYNLNALTQLRMDVDAVALRRAVNVLVGQHESLRTVFRVVGGEPRQVVVSGVWVPLEASDLRRLPPSERTRVAERLIADFASRPFVLQTGPLLRSALLRLGEREFVLLLGVHHVVADGWSMGVLSRELGAVYGDVVGGGDGRVLAELPVQYADFAVWQRERLSGVWLRDELAWWRSRLEGLSVLALPTDRARPAVQGHRGDGFGFGVDAGVVERLGVVARESSATLFMVGLAVWSVVLGRWCAQDEVVVGAPIAGRDRAELEGLIGFFVNTLVMRVDLSGDPTLVELVGRVREVALDAYAHAEVPFEKLVEELAPERDLSRNPLFQVTFQLFDSPADPATNTTRTAPTPHRTGNDNHDGLWTTPAAAAAGAGSGGGGAAGGAGSGGGSGGGGLEVPVSSSLFDVRLDLWPADDGWSGRVEFDTDLFDRSSIEALIERFVWLCDHASRHPHERIDSWALLPDRHRELLATWNDTAAPIRPITIVDAIAEQIATHPDRIAVSDDTDTWTYADLDHHTNHITHQLHQLHDQPDRGRFGEPDDTRPDDRFEQRVIAVCVPRGRLHVAAALAAMRTRAAYLPLDPAYPPARLSHIIDHARPDAIITTPTIAPTLTTTNPPPLITDLTPTNNTNTDVTDGDSTNTDNTDNDGDLSDGDLSGLDGDLNDGDLSDLDATTKHSDGPRPHDLAYVIYTSGSTGEPKGVEIEHHSLINLIDWHTTTYDIHPHDRATQIASTGFDAAVWEIWPYLATGASIHTPTDHTRADPTTLINWLHTNHITIAFIPTPLTETLLDHPWPTPSPLRYLLTGGDTLHHHPNPHHPYTLINHYGPTETTVVATATTPTTHHDPHQPPTIGHPITNTTCTITDHKGHPTGPAQPGELHISGPTLARGYHHDPHLTTTRFTHHPTGTDTTRRYHTGDLTRWNPNGTITFLGRTDHQLKIRGHRIEPTELETIITTHPHITHTTITTHPHPTTNTPQLCAYITTTNPPPTTTDIHAQVSAWKDLYDRTYDSTMIGVDRRFDIRGWNDSGSGHALGADVMEEQVRQTVDRILTRAPRSVLEIGCGTGLILLRVAPFCERYVGTDFSAVVLDQLATTVFQEGLQHVELLQRSADDLEGVSGPFDMIVLNSVVQYFPSIEYLERVLHASSSCLSETGTIFVGDVRNRALLDVFHTDVELARSDREDAVEALRARIRRSVANEQELLVDPGWFGEIADRAPGTMATRSRRSRLDQVTHVSAHPRRGRHDTELTRYRYDVTIEFGERASPEATEAVEWSEWADWDDTALVTHLSTADRPVGVRGVPTTRLAASMSAYAGLHELGPGTVGNFLEDHEAADTGIDPELIWNLPGVDVEVSWHDGGADGTYDVIAAPAGLGVRPSAPSPRLNGRPPANEPLRTSPPIDEIREWMATQLPEALIPAHIVPIDEVPLTPHGKVDLSALPIPSPTTTRRSETLVAEESILAGAWEEVLGLHDIGRDDNFFSIGGDSILAIKVVARAAAAELHFSTTDLFQNQTIAELARVASHTPRVVAEQGPVTGVVPMTPIQLWFTELELADPHHFNQAASLPIDRRVDVKLLVRALRAVIDHHDALRLRLDGDSPTDLIFDPAGRELRVTTADLSKSPRSRLAELVDQVATRVQASVSLNGAPVACALIELGALVPRRLIVAVHHLAVDAVSWQIIFEDLWQAYEQLAGGRPVALADKTTSYRAWSERLRAYATDAALHEEIPMWRNHLSGRRPDLPADQPDGANTVGDSTSIRVELSAEETHALFHDLLPERHVDINSVLLAAAGRALADWADIDEVPIVVEGHGREDIFSDVDLTRTVGWFTSIHPLRLDISRGTDWLALLTSVADQLDAVPHRGIGFGVLRYLAEAEDLTGEIARSHWPQISFNYLGRLDRADDSSPVDPLHDSTGASRSPSGQRPYLIDLNGGLSGGHLWFDVHYSAAQFDDSTIEPLATAFTAGLRAMLAASATAPLAPRISTAVDETEAGALLTRLSRTSDQSP